MSRGTLLRAPLLLVLLALLGSAPLALADPRWKDGEVIIKFKETARPGEVASIRRALRASRIKHFGRIRADHERISGLTVEEAVARYRGNPAVEYIEPNYVVHTTAVPNDPSFDQQWALRNTGQTGGRPGADISATLAWDLTTGSDILVGMVDTGVDYTHPDLAANIFVNPGEIPNNGIDDDANGFVDDVHGWDFVNGDNDPMDDHGHGTHTAGTVGAVGNNGIGITGVNWHVRLLPLKFLSSGGFGSNADAVSCIEYATMMHARLSSNSWGGPNYSQAMFDAIQDANAAGILLVAAAGNAANDNDQNPFYPAAYALPNVITVAATNSSDAMAGFSSYGATTVHLGAPGVAILSTTPENTYSVFNGTSMACPHVAGALALVLSRYPTLSAEHAKRLIMDSTDPLPALHGYVQSGGRLNVARALAGPDTIPPAAIESLAVLSSTSNRIRLGWIATGNDGSVGAALTYDLRYAAGPITEATFAGATRFPDMPGPALSGTRQEVTVTGLDPSTRYTFALKALDGFENASPISNLAFGETLAPPDIHVSPASLSVSLGLNGTDSRTITIENPSAGILDFEIGYATVGAPGTAPAAAAATAVSVPRPRAWGDYARQAASLETTSSVAAADNGAVASLPVVVTDPSGDGGTVDITELRALPDQTNLNVELRFAGPIDRQHFGGFLFLDIDQNRFTGVPPAFAAPGHDIGAEFEIQLFSLAAGLVQLFHAQSHTLLANVPVTIESQALRFSLPLFSLGEDDGSIDVTGVVGSEAAPTDFVPDTGHGTIRGVRWVRATPESGSIPPGGSLDLAVAFDSRGLREGAYDGTIRITSNDPDQPVVSVAAHADVTGVPRIDVTTLEFDFGVVTVGTSRTDSLVISNFGTSALHLFGVVSDAPAFAVGPVPPTIAPGDRRSIALTFTPTGVGPASGNLQVSSDDPEGGELFGLFAGSGTPPPRMEASTQELRANLRTGETSSQPLLLSNTGPGDLVVGLSVRSFSAATLAAASAPNPSPAVGSGARSIALADSTPVESGVLGGISAQTPILVIQDTRSWGVDVGPLLLSRFGLPVRVIHASQVGEADFARYDVIITVSDEHPEYYAVISANAPKFADYVRAGGTVLYSVGTYPQGVSLAGGVQYQFGSYEDQNRPLLPRHPILTGLPWLLSSNLLNFGFLTNLVAGTSVLTETYLTHLPTMVEYTLGKGRVVATGITWEYEYNFGTPLAAMLPQAVAYALSQVNPRWLRVEPANAVIPTGQSLTAQVTFDAGWAAGGGHDAFIHVGSNDPDRRELVVPAHLEVTPLPDIALSRTTMPFGPLFVNGSRADSLMVSNEGTAPLSVTEIATDNAIFVASPGPFSLAPGESIGVKVTFHPVALGAAAGILRIRSNDEDEPERTVTLSGEGIPAPVVSVTPTALQLTLAVGGHESRTLSLGNQGGNELSFGFEFQAPPGTAAIHTAFPASYGEAPLKGAPDTRVGAAALAHLGGPDHFGHSWIDSDEPGGPAFEWVEISGIGTKVPMLGDDIFSSLIPIGFDFPFHGNAFTSFRISSNGYLSFTSRTSDYTNWPLPGNLAPENLLAPFWDDLYAAYLSSVFVHSNGDRTVIQFQDFIPVIGPLEATYNFEVILYPSGEFKFQYLSMLGPTNGATVGFQNAAKDDGLTVAFNTAYLHDRMALRVTSRPRWIALDPAAGDIAPGGTAGVRADVDATGLALGSYATVLKLHSNDPVTPVVDIPIQLRVLAAVEATATRISPSTLNEKGGGRVVQAFVELPREVDPTQVVLSSVRFQGTVPCDQRVLRLGDFNLNGIPDLQFQFDRGAALAALPEGSSVPVTVTGEVAGVALFTGRATVRVIRPHMNAPNGGETLAYGSTSTIRWDTPADWAVDHADLAYSLDDGATWIPLAQDVPGHEFPWFLPPVASSTARVRVSLYDGTGLLGFDSSDEAFAITQATTRVTEPAPPLVTALYQNSPNPFNPSTNIRFDLPRASRVLLVIHGADGRVVRRLVDEALPAGRQRVVWDGRDDRGRPAAAGVYYYRLTAEAFSASRRLVLLK